MLSIQNITYRVGGRTLLDNVSVNIPAGRRVGLVGPQWCREIHAFQDYLRDIAADGGDISFIKGASLGMVRRICPTMKPLFSMSCSTATLSVQPFWRKPRRSEDPERMSYIYDRLNEISAYDAPSRAASILAGLVSAKWRGRADFILLRRLARTRGFWRLCCSGSRMCCCSMSRRPSRF